MFEAPPRPVDGAGPYKISEAQTPPETATRADGPARGAPTKPFKMAPIRARLRFAPQPGAPFDPGGAGPPAEVAQRYCASLESSWAKALGSSNLPLGTPSRRNACCAQAAGFIFWRAAFHPFG